jgi:hypothetical protein
MEAQRVVYPMGKPTIPHLQRCQGFAVGRTTASPFPPWISGILGFCSIMVKTDGFWHRIPKPGYDLDIEYNVSSMERLQEMYFGAKMDEEQFGTGIQRILDDCRSQQLSEPDFQVQGHTFRAVFTPREAGVGEKEDAGRTERQNRALVYIRQHGRITRAEYEEISGLPVHTAKGELAGMVKTGLIIRRGGGRNHWYELRDSGGVPQSAPQNPTGN